MNGDNIKNNKTKNLVQMILEPDSNESKYLKFKLEEITKNRKDDTSGSSNGLNGFIMYNKYIAPYLTSFDNEQEYIILQMYLHGGLITFNAKHAGYHTGVKGHAHDLKKAYAHCAMGDLPTGRMMVGRGPEGCIQLVKITCDGFNTFSKYENALPPLFQGDLVIPSSPIPVNRADGKVVIEFKKNDLTVGRKHGLLTGEPLTYYLFEEELEELKRTIYFSNLKIEYTYGYERCTGLLDDSMESMINKATYKANYKGGICASIGCLARRPILGEAGIEFYKTYSIMNAYITMKCRIMMMDEARELADAKNTVLAITTDCIYGIGNTNAVVNPGSDGYGGFGDGLFSIAGVSTKNCTTFDSYTLINATLAGYELNGYRVKTSHSSIQNPNFDFGTFLDVLPLDQGEYVKDCKKSIVEVFGEYNISNSDKSGSAETNNEKI